MWNGIDRRKFPRVHYKCLICLTKRGSAKTISTHTENIGAGGICVILTEDLGLFQGVNLELELKNGISTNINCSGTVVWVVKKRDIKAKDNLKYDTGIEFVDIDEDGRDRIIKVISTKIK